MKKVVLIIPIILMCLTSCFDVSHKEIHLTRNFALIHNEGDSTNYYSVCEVDGNFSNPIVENKAIAVYNDSLNILFKTINWKKDTDFHYIILNQKPSLPFAVLKLSKSEFLEKLKLCPECKKVTIK
ncbi:hypothetical protein KXQ82_07935 [Mucilaginibacter sp. HMF5004]|uniref:hypothetical protein n=1 Tax=Mucilaginibacter rivuli TaxID=2857527 RepID=UPI001C5EB8FF|nr:hypothetical protein [Mucilaginibacter rivuli]MBW4889641.1 hypothetical protein [Mucilaginibacter rivuli]